MGTMPEPTVTVSRRSIVVLLVALIAHIGLFFSLHGNFEFDRDAPHYARISHEIEQGEFELARHPFSQRFGVTVPTAVSYRLFGVNPVSTTLWPLICSLLAIVLVFNATARFFGGRTAAIAALLLALNVVAVRYNSRLVPDVIVSTFMLATASLVHLGRYTESRPRQLLVGIGTGVVLSAGVMVKETAVWVVPFLVLIMVGDLIRGRSRYLWAAVVGCGLAWLLVVLGVYHELTGEALYRLKGIDSTHNARGWSFLGKSDSEYLHRATIAPIQFFLEKPGYFLPIALALPALLNVLRPARHLPPGVRYWGSYLMTLFIAFWLGSTSLEFYNPLPLVERFMIALLPPLAILGAVTMTHLSGRGDHVRRFGIGLSAVVFLLGAIALGIRGWSLAAVYGALALPTLALWILPPGRSGPAFLARAAIVLLYFVPLVDYARSGDPIEAPETYFKEQELLARHTGLVSQPTTLITDKHSAFVLPFFLEPEVLAQFTILDWDRGRRFMHQTDKRRLVYVHQSRMMAMLINWEVQRPGYVLNPPSEWRLLDSMEIEGRPAIFLYEVDG